MELKWYLRVYMTFYDEEVLVKTFEYSEEEKTKMFSDYKLCETFYSSLNQETDAQLRYEITYEPE